MFNLFRRISGSVIPRPDRPWKDDATSNAPQTGRKRRLSIVDGSPEQHASLKKIRGRGWGVPESADDGSPGQEESQTQQKETEEVKDVTKGVKEVVLEDSPEQGSSSTSSTPTPPPESQVEEEAVELKADAEGNESESSTPEATQPEVAEAATSELVTSSEEHLDAAPLVEASTSDGVTDTEKVGVPKEAILALEREVEDKGKSS